MSIRHGYAIFSLSTERYCMLMLIAEDSQLSVKCLAPVVFLAVEKPERP